MAEIIAAQHGWVGHGRMSSEVSYSELTELASKLSTLLERHPFKRKEINIKNGILPKIYGIPRGGVPTMLALRAYGSVFPIFCHTADIEEADGLVDDLVDSGRTAEKFANYDLPLFVLIRKGPQDKWIRLPWEAPGVADVEDHVIRLLEFVGENPSRGGLKDTPGRYLRALREATSGYDKDLGQVFKSFSDGGESYDQIVFQGRMEFHSLCEHHLAPFFGTVSIGYLPKDGRVIGLSKLHRLVEVFARRLQVQERLTAQIAEALYSHLPANGVGVVLECRHLCMESRGVKKPGTKTITSALRGVFRHDDCARNEFFNLVHLSKGVSHG